MDSETARPPGDEGLPAADGAPTGWAARLTAPVSEGLMAISVIDTVAIGLSIAGLVAINQWSSPDHLPLLVASLASSVVVLYSLPGLDIARSWNVIAGQFIGALSGYVCVTVIGHRQIVVAGCAVALSYVVMRLANALHPPGAATALLVAIVPADDGTKFLFFPVLAGAILITVFAWLVHLGERNLLRHLDRERRIHEG